MLGFRNIILNFKKLVMQYRQVSLLNISRHRKFQMFGMDQSNKISDHSGLWLAVEFGKTIEKTPVRELLAITFVGD